ncbi:HIT domain-containing protein [Luteimonas sp. 3794]|uniref:HIT family protein n=1 Tax=Luteimonas sp. 3794 TaxID=2817730 RepID=UPI00285B6EEE|nr:HIT domain-containing protein [Luteimonas sp. 3794]MDR6993133.1 histidine triad (HIT) family protein [Luteimonas sp. 3794]
MSSPPAESSADGCAILSGALPASLAHEDDQVIAFMDLRQAVPGHVLVVPRQRVDTLLDLDEDTAVQLMRVAVRIARATEYAFAPDGLNLWQSNREAGGQEVPHVHLHVQPRRIGDGLLRIYPAAPPVPAPRDALDALATALRAALAKSQAKP